MPSWAKVFSGSGEYLSADEFDKAYTFKITSVTPTMAEAFEQSNKRVPKLIIALEGQKRTWLAGKSCAKLLGVVLGTDDYARWPGRHVTLHAYPLPVKGDELRKGIRPCGAPDMARSVTVTLKFKKAASQTYQLGPTGKQAGPAPVFEAPEPQDAPPREPGQEG